MVPDVVEVVDLATEVAYPVVHSRHPLAEAAAAHREIEESGHVGKILLTVG